MFYEGHAILRKITKVRYRAIKLFVFKMLSLFIESVTTKFKNRYHAFVFHLIFSLIIAGGILLFAKLLWYPQELIVPSGALRIFLLVLMVDACFGPLVTLLVFSKKKEPKELKSDFSIIVALQLCALVYGFYTLFSGRPVFYVFAVDRFELVQANHIPVKFLSEEEAGVYSKLPKTGPRWVYAKAPEDNKERNLLLSWQVQYGVDLAQTPKYYEPLDHGASVIRERVRPLKDLMHSNTKEQINNEMRAFSLPVLSIENDVLSNDINDYGYLPLAASKKDLTVIVNKATLDVKGILDLNPWKETQ